MKKTENVINARMKFNKKHAQEVVGQGEKEERKQNDFRKKLVRLENARFPMEIGLLRKVKETEYLRSFLRAGTGFECLTILDNFLKGALLNFLREGNCGKVRNVGMSS